MSTVKRLLLALLLATFALLGAGCATKDKDHTSMPWGRPAQWEGRIPGMGT